MGIITKVTCMSCKTAWQCQTGCGLMHGDLDRVLDLYSEDSKKEMKALAGEMDFPWFDFGYQLSCCAHCSSIESVPVLKLGDNHTEFAGDCEQCGHKTQLIKDLQKTPCPVCHKETLFAEEIGMWD